MGNIPDTNYFVVQAFMVNELNLKSNERDVFAIIYGFSQTEANAYTGGLQYLMDWTNSSKQSVVNWLKSLESKGYIERIERNVRGVKFFDYRSKIYTEGSKI